MAFLVLTPPSHLGGQLDHSDHVKLQSIIQGWVLHSFSSSAGHSSPSFWCGIEILAFLVMTPPLQLAEHVVHSDHVKLQSTGVGQGGV